MSTVFLKSAVLSIAIISQAFGASAAIQEQRVEYKDGQAVLEGFLVYDDASEAKRPGVLVVHEWKGLGPYAERRARQLAELGYIAFAVDMYGKGVHPQTHEEAGALAGMYFKDRTLTRQRISAGYDVLKNFPFVDDTKIAAVGYCFGGMTVLELARSGADVKGVVTFHGSLANPKPEDDKNIKCKVLILHGADDPHIPMKDVEFFKKEMQDAGVDWRMEIYPGAAHSFTVEEAGNDPSKGAAYNKEADERSWAEMKKFFEQIFK